MTIYHSFTLGQIFVVSIKIGNILENQWEFIVDKRCHKKCTVQHPAHFRLFFNVRAEKLMAHFQFSFESWVNNADSEIYIYFSFKIHTMVAGKS